MKSKTKKNQGREDEKRGKGGGGGLLCRSVAYMCELGNRRRNKRSTLRKGLVKKGE